MESLANFISAINGFVWGVPMLVLILGVGIYLTLGLKLMPIVKIGAGFKLLWTGRIPEKEEEAKGEISRSMP